MLGLSAGELDAIRADIAQMLPDTCVLYTQSYIPDGMGGGTIGWNVAGTVACRLDRKTGYEKLAADAARPYGEWMLTIPHNATISVDMRVVHGGETYDVVAVNDDKSWRDCIRAEVEWLKAP